MSLNVVIIFPYLGSCFSFLNMKHNYGTKLITFTKSTANLHSFMHVFNIY